MKTPNLPQSVLNSLSDCIPPCEDYTGICVTEKGIFTFQDGKPSQPSGQWGEIFYSGYYQDEEEN